MSIASWWHASHEILISLGLDACVLSVESGVDVAVPGCRLVGTAYAMPDESAACKIRTRSWSLLRLVFYTLSNWVPQYIALLNFIKRKSHYLGAFRLTTFRTALAPYILVDFVFSMLPKQVAYRAEVWTAWVHGKFCDPMSYGSPPGISNLLVDSYLSVRIPHISYRSRDAVLGIWLDSAFTCHGSVSNSLTNDFPSLGLYQYLTSYISSPAPTSAPAPAPIPQPWYSPAWVDQMITYPFGRLLHCAFQQPSLAVREWGVISWSISDSWFLS